MYLTTDYRYGVTYHSALWAELVEQGWITMHETSPGVVTMIRQIRGRR